MTKPYWDFIVKVKNFSANNVIDSRDLRVYEDIIFRNGRMKTQDISKDDLKHFMIFNPNYLDIISCDDEIYNMIGWINQFVKSNYAISFVDTSKKILTAKIRLFDLDMAFKFKLQFYNFIELENNND